MQAEDVPQSFTELLTRTGADPERPDLPRTWQAFKSFAAVPIAGTQGGLLFECGTSGDASGDFSVHFLRYFYHDGATYMVDCTFRFEAVAALSRCHIVADAEGGEAPDAAPFIDEVEADREFWQTVAEREARKASVYIGED